LGYGEGNPTIIGTKTFIEEGKILTYKIEYRNIGKGTATSVVIIDQIPEGTKYIENSAGTETLPATIKYSNKYHPYDWKLDETEISPVIYILWEIGTIITGNFGAVTFKVKRRD